MQPTSSSGRYGARPFNDYRDEYTGMWYTEYMRGDEYTATSHGRRKDRTFVRLIMHQVPLRNKLDFEAQRAHPNALPWFTVTPFQPQ